VGLEGFVDGVVGDGDTDEIVGRPNIRRMLDDLVIASHGR
jgi:hypothetical protein